MAREGEFNPAGVAPIEVQPYQPVAGPEVTPPAPSPLPTRPPEVNGAVKTSGAIATMADGILRGFMQGRAFGEARKVMRLKAQADNLQNSYNQDASLLYNMKAQGVDPNNAEYKRALSAVQGSWGALMTFYGQHIQPEDTGKKKSRLKRVEGGIASAFESKDPMEVSRAWYQIAQKAGPPVLGQVAALDTPEAQAARKARAESAQNAEAGEQVRGVVTQQQLSEAQQALRYSQITGKPEKDWTPDEKDFIEQYDSLHGKASEELIRERAALGQRILDNPDLQLTSSEQMLLTGKNPTSAPKVGSFGDFMVQAYGPHPSASEYEQGKKLWAQSGASTTIGQHVIMVPQPDGSVRAVTVETTSHKYFPGAPPPNPSPNASTQSAWIGSSTAKPLFVVGGNAGKVPGMKQAGNINIMHRPNVSNPDGTWSSVRTISIGTDKGEVLIPTVSDGSDGKPPRVMTNDEAIAEYKRTGKNLGIFDTPEHATAYAEKLHEQQAHLGSMKGRGASPASPPAHAAKPAARASSPAPRGAGIVSMGPIVGGRQTPDVTKAKEELDAANRLDQVAHSQDIFTNGSTQYTLLSTLLHSSIGRVNMTEITQMMSSAGLGTKIEGWYTKAQNGTLPPALIRQLQAASRDWKVGAEKAYQEAEARSHGESLETEMTPIPPKGATQQVWGSDGKWHWTDGKHDLGIVQ